MKILTYLKRHGLEIQNERTQEYKKKKKISSGGSVTNKDREKCSLIVPKGI